MCDSTSNAPNTHARTHSRTHTQVVLAISGGTLVPLVVERVSLTQAQTQTQTPTRQGPARPYLDMSHDCDAILRTCNTDMRRGGGESVEARLPVLTNLRVAHDFWPDGRRPCSYKLASVGNAYGYHRGDSPLCHLLPDACQRSVKRICTCARVLP